jgi:hypothetical protein
MSHAKNQEGFLLTAQAPNNEEVILRDNSSNNVDKD